MGVPSFAAMPLSFGLAYGFSGGEKEIDGNMIMDSQAINRTFELLNILPDTPESEIAEAVATAFEGTLWTAAIGPLVKTFKLLQPNLKGRKRSKIFLLDDYKEVVRYYDGEDNPKGIAYTKKEILDILKKNFIIEKTYLHYFPLRTLRFKLPRFIHKFLDKQLGFMIYLNVKKKVKKIV